jgi:hypothetical protein
MPIGADAYAAMQEAALLETYLLIVPPSACTDGQLDGKIR